MPFKIAGGIAAEKEIADRETHPIRLRVMRSIVREMAPSAPGGEVGVSDIGRPMIAVRACQDDADHPEPIAAPERRALDRLAPVVAPSAGGAKLAPSSIGRLRDEAAMWPTASLAMAVRAIKPDAPRDRRPIDRIEIAKLRTDRHPATLPDARVTSETSRERNARQGIEVRGSAAPHSETDYASIDGAGRCPPRKCSAMPRKLHHPSRRSSRTLSDRAGMFPWRPAACSALPFGATVAPALGQSALEAHHCRQPFSRVLLHSGLRL